MRRRSLPILILVLVLVAVAGSTACTSGQPSSSEQPATQQPAEQQPAPSQDPTATDPVQPAALDGKILFEERCSLCHPLTRAAAEDRDAAGWAEIVDQMIGRGAQLTAEERQAVIDYLAKTYPKQ